MPLASKRFLWVVSARTTPEAEDAVTQLLERTFGQHASSYTDAESGQTVVSVYLSSRSRWSPAQQKEVEAGIEGMAANGLDIGRGKVSLKAVRREDWAESWKRHFKPLVIGSALLLKPGWSRRRARRGQAVVVLDPGLSFGTGRHPTTGFCLRQVVARRRAGQAQSFLDVGTGSGILAIAAAKLGYAPVEGFDNDAQAVRVAEANAHRNRVAGKVRFRRQDLRRLPPRTRRQYSVVCANLIAPLLLEERDRLLAQVRPDGALVVAGILKAEFGRVQAAFAAAGLRLVASRAEGEWRSGAFVWRRGF